MNVSILTIASGEEYLKTVELGLLSKTLYAEKHGYDFRVTSRLLDKKRSASWNKIPFILSELHKFDWIFWSDADTVIMEDEVRLESFIREDKDLIIACDPFGLNAGEFFIRNSPFSFQLLETLYAMEAFIHDKGFEQKALKTLLKNHPELWGKIYVEKTRAFNALWPEYFMHSNIPIFSHYPQSGYHEGDFLVHLCWGKEGLEELQSGIKAYFSMKKQKSLL